MAILRSATADLSLLRQNPGLFRACLACGKCEQSCPANLPLAKIFLGIRLNLEIYSGKSLVDKIKFSLFQKPAFDGLNSLMKIAKTKRVKPLPHALRFRVKKSPPENGKESVLLFPGCIGKKTRPSLGYAACEALKSGGFAALSPSGLRCCGKLPGFTEKSLLSACRANLKILMRASFTKMAVICPSCLDMIRNIWPGLDGLESSERRFCEDLANRVHYIGNFFTPLPRSTDSTQKALWHEGCQLSSDDSEIAMKALGLPPRAKVASGCCGGAYPTLWPEKGEKGILLESKPSAAEKLAKISRDELLSRKPDVVITGCPHCLLALDDIFAKRRDKIRVLHAVEYFCGIQKVE